MQSPERPPARWNAALPKGRNDASAALWAEHERLRLEIDRSPRQGSDPESGWRREAIALLDRVRWALEDHSEDFLAVHEAWGWALDARRKLVHAMGVAQQHAEATALHNEAEEKIHGWRKDAILQLVERREGETVDADALERALQLRDGHSQNRYRDAFTIRERVAHLLGPLLVGIFGALGALVFVDLIEAGVEDPEAALLVVAFGLLGGSISAFRPLSRGGVRYPEQRGAWYLTLARPFTGAAAALALYPFVLAGLVPVELDSLFTLAALSVAAGFSERPLSRAIGAAGGRED